MSFVELRILMEFYVESQQQDKLMTLIDVINTKMESISTNIGQKSEALRNSSCEEERIKIYAQTIAFLHEIIPVVAVAVSCEDIRNQYIEAYKPFIDKWLEKDKKEWFSFLTGK